MESGFGACCRRGKWPTSGTLVAAYAQAHTNTEEDPGVPLLDRFTMAIGVSRLTLVRGPSDKAGCSRKPQWICLFLQCHQVSNVPKFASKCTYNQLTTLPSLAGGWQRKACQMSRAHYSVGELIIANLQPCTVLHCTNFHDCHFRSEGLACTPLVFFSSALIVTVVVKQRLHRKSRTHTWQCIRFCVNGAV